jgi:hypothetical protein
MARHPSRASSQRLSSRTRTLTPISMLFDALCQPNRIVSSTSLLISSTSTVRISENSRWSSDARSLPSYSAIEHRIRQFSSPRQSRAPAQKSSPRPTSLGWAGCSTSHPANQHAEELGECRIALAGQSARRRRRHRAIAIGRRCRSLSALHARGWHRWRHRRDIDVGRAGRRASQARAACG